MYDFKINLKANFSAYKGVCVIGQHIDGQLLPVSLELIGEGRKLADQIGTKLYVVILGNKIEEAVSEISYYGADKIFYYEHELLEQYSTDAYTKIICDFIENYKPEIVLFGATSIGRDFAPRIAARIGTGLTADCTELRIDDNDKKLLQVRPAFGGNVLATIICPMTRPQMATVRPGVMVKPKKLKNNSEIIKIKPNLTIKDIRIKITDLVLGKIKKVSLVDANVIVSGGRGVGSKEGFKLLEQLAEVLGGVVGGSRVAVENGWIDQSQQVGQTGQTVRPKIYIACGISGSIQHLAGMSESEFIIAINKNPNAPIMAHSHLAIEGDLFKVIPEIIKEIEENKIGIKKVPLLNK